MTAIMPHPPNITSTDEAGGVVLTCECQWTRFCANRPQADAERHAHAKKCKGPKVKPEQTARRASSASWDDREGATWIDQI